MSEVAQALMTGFFVGGIYGLVGIGLTLIFGAMKLMNLAHGSFLTVLIFVTYLLSIFFGVSPFLLIPVTMLLGLLFGMFVFSTVIRPVLNAPERVILLLTMALMFLLDNSLVSIFAITQPHWVLTVSPDYALGQLTFGTISIGFAHLIAFGSALIVSMALYWVLGWTQFGRYLRACVDDSEAAAMIGINVRRTYLFTFSIGCMTLGVAAPLILVIYYASPDIGTHFLIRMFAVVIVGGMGNFIGAFVAGLMLGTAEGIAGLFLPGTFYMVIPMILIIIILLVRPKGLFGQ